MKIGYDAKRLFHNKTGLGNYSRNLLNALIEYYPQHDYSLFIHKKYLDGSIYKYKEFVERIVLSEHLVADYWRTNDIAEDMINQEIEIFHGLSNELPLSMPKGVKKIVTIHDLIFQRYPDFFPFLDRQIYKFKTKSACEQADVIVAVSTQTKEDIIEFYGIDDERIVVIPPTWNKHYESQISIVYLEEIRLKYNLPEQFMLYVGAINSRKNLLKLLEAMQLLEMQDTILIIVSDGGEEAELFYAKIREYKLENRVFVLNGISNFELPAFYKLATICVYPSIYEGFGMPVMEALNLGVPVVASDIATMHEVGGDSILYFDPEDKEAMAMAILKGMNDNTWRTNAIIKGKSQIQQFSPISCATKMMEVYSTYTK